MCADNPSLLLSYWFFVIGISWRQRCKSLAYVGNLELLVLKNSCAYTNQVKSAGSRASLCSIDQTLMLEAVGRLSVSITSRSLASSGCINLVSNKYYRAYFSREIAKVKVARSGAAGD